MFYMQRCTWICVHVSVYKIFTYTSCIHVFLEYLKTTGCLCGWKRHVLHRQKPGRAIPVAVRQQEVASGGTRLCLWEPGYQDKLLDTEPASSFHSANELNAF